HVVATEQFLDGDHAAEPSIAGLEDATEAAAGEFAFDEVGARAYDGELAFAWVCALGRRGLCRLGGIVVRAHAQGRPSSERTEIGFRLRANAHGLTRRDAGGRAAVIRAGVRSTVAAHAPAKGSPHLAETIPADVLHGLARQGELPF